MIVHQKSWDPIVVSTWFCCCSGARVIVAVEPKAFLQVIMVCCNRFFGFAAVSIIDSSKWSWSTGMGMGSNGLGKHQPRMYSSIYKVTSTHNFFRKKHTFVNMHIYSKTPISKFISSLEGLFIQLYFKLL